MSAAGAAISDADRTIVRSHRIAVLAKRLLATAPLYDAGLSSDHRPVDPEACEETALAVALIAHSTGAEMAEYATLHQLEPEALHDAAPRIVARAWRRLVASGPQAESEWHRAMALQIVCIVDTLPATERT